MLTMAPVHGRPPAIRYQLFSEGLPMALAAQKAR